jgi:predicted ATP-dependent protease
MTKKTKKTVPSVKTVRRLSAAQLCFICDPKSLGFKSTNDLESPSEIIGQDRAVAAIQFGVGIDKEGYNMFALGPSGAGKHSVIRQFLDGRAGDMPTPPDTCYVNNFIQSYKPVLIQLPAGRGAGLRQDMAQLVEMVNVAIPRAFEGDEYRNRRQKLEAHFKEAQEALFEGVHKEAHDNAINVRRTSGGLVMSPMKDGEPIEPEVFQKLPEAEQKRVHDIIEMLEEKLRNALAEMPALERQFREDIQEINQGITVFAIGHLIDDLKNRYGDVANVQAYLDAVRKDMVAHAENFLPPSPTPDPAGGTGQSAEERDPNFLVRYQVNLLVDHSADDGAPVVYEDLPNLQSLIGRIEHIAQYGALSTNFTLIQPGALHRANGGYLILDARKILTAPFAWDELKRVLKSREIRIESPERLMSVATTVTLEPAPHPS